MSFNLSWDRFFSRPQSHQTLDHSAYRARNGFSTAAVDVSPQTWFLNINSAGRLPLMFWRIHHWHDDTISMQYPSYFIDRINLTSTSDKIIFSSLAIIPNKALWAPKSWEMAFNNMIRGSTVPRNRYSFCLSSWALATQMISLAVYLEKISYLHLLSPVPRGGPLLSSSNEVCPFQAIFIFLLGKEALLLVPLYMSSEGWAPWNECGMNPFQPIICRWRQVLMCFIIEFPCPVLYSSLVFTHHTCWKKWQLRWANLGLLPSFSASRTEG